MNAEKEKLVIDLYYNQRKNVRQIAQEARISFRDIAAIIKKKEAAVNVGDGSENEKGQVDNQQQSNDSNSSNKSPNENATQAYKLFDEAMKPVEVAIQLGLAEYKASKYYREYLELVGLYEVTFLYEERKHQLPSFLKLNKILEREGIHDEKDIANVLKYEAALT